ncbi:MAG: peptide chain release factor-like protein [Phycisphaerae bacterium]|nr:peptide chain release factor-like protein [Phycisphaerae bacterium]
MHVEDEKLLVQPPHPASLDPQDLLAQCTTRTGRVSGPGGTNRNKVDTAIELIHDPTGLSVTATERRSQHQNRSRAIDRLRRRLAIECRTRIDPKRQRPSELWAQRRQGDKMPINPRHEDYPTLLAEAMDLVTARRYDLAGAAGMLGITMSQLCRLIRHEKKAMARINQGRDRIGLHRIKA